MNRWFAQLQIRNKLIVLLLATSAGVLGLASVGHLYFQYMGVRADAGNDLRTHAKLLLDSAAAPLSFN